MSINFVDSNVVMYNYLGKKATPGLNGNLGVSENVP
jgi:hypothetical protein